MRILAAHPAVQDFPASPGEATWRELSGVPYALKGILDRLLAVVALAILVIPMCIIAVLVKQSSPGPVFIRQVRVGRYGRPFVFWKFRSMRQDAEEVRERIENLNNHCARTLFKMRKDPRTTRVGAFLRRTSLDELPNLFNVVRGEMSIIGPRPPLPREVAHYEPRHMQRLAAMPGMTGLWQVRGRSELDFEQMVGLDLEYIERWSLWLDLSILVRTPIAVIGGKGAW